MEPQRRLSILAAKELKRINKRPESAFLHGGWTSLFWFLKVFVGDGHNICPRTKSGKPTLVFCLPGRLQGVVRGLVTCHNKAIKNQKLAVALLPTFGAIAKSASARLAESQADETTLKLDETICFTKLFAIC